MLPPTLGAPPRKRAGHETTRMNRGEKSQCVYLEEEDAVMYRDFMLPHFKLFAIALKKYRYVVDYFEKELL